MCGAGGWCNIGGMVGGEGSDFEMEGDGREGSG